MPVMIVCDYRDGGATDRLAIRDVHLEYIIANLSRLRFAGALASDDDTAATGMLIVHETDDVDEAKAFMAAEPYLRTGLFARVSYRRMRQFIPHPVVPDFLQQELVRERARLAREAPA